MTEGLAFPREATAEIIAVLSLLPWELRRAGDVLRKAGEPVPESPPGRQAFVYHWLVTLALEYGPHWQDAARARLEELAGRRGAPPNPEPGT